MRAEVSALRDSYSSRHDGTPGGRVQADIAYANHTATLTAMTVAEDRLCFGRLDMQDGELMHIGRMGIFDRGAHGRQLLMDWRAPSARPFYVATAAAPLGVLRRRHLKVRRRKVTDVSDEYLELRPELLGRLGRDAVRAAGRQGVAGESALLDALNAPRTGRMADIVETIQAEQDAIIRSDRSGVLVVQGGPGTGKTAVALHRTAYLLYTYRDQLINHGVLIIGPNRTFLEYIGQVLPSLGENAVVLSTLGDLFPGVRTAAVDSPEVAALKGRPRMAAVVADALLDRQRMPKVPLTFSSGQGPLVLDPQVMAKAQARAWGTRLPHNRARHYFLQVVLRDLTRQVADRHRQGLGGQIPFTSDDFADARAELVRDEAVRRALAPWWPLLTPQRLLTGLFASRKRLRLATGGFDEKSRALLFRPAGSPWTISDVPLLDEAGELLGPLPGGGQEQSADDGERREFAESVLQMLADDTDSDEAETGDRSLLGMISARDLSEMADQRVTLTSTAERAGADREWTYGHIVVDEAQELSPMAWRMVMRRCPMRSMTLVGDVAQTSDPAGVSNWANALRPHVGDRWRLAELTVNYRTPREITALADRVLRHIDPALRPPDSVRSTGIEPWLRSTDDGRLIRDVEQAVRQELERGPGLVAVLCPRELAASLREALAALISDRVSVLSVGQAKGLEFDSVILVEPERIRRESRRGWGDLYVALTRATQRLGILYSGAAPRWAHPEREQVNRPRPARRRGGRPAPNRPAPSSSPSR